jgi:cytochrome c biogenesis protein CcdA
MALTIFFLSFSAASWVPAAPRPLRHWGHRVQAVAAAVMVVVGLALVYAAVDPGFWDRLILMEDM